jgi:hypothetical protein
VAVGQRHAKHRPRQDLSHLAVQFDWLFFRHGSKFVSVFQCRQTPGLSEASLQTLPFAGP